VVLDLDINLTALRGRDGDERVLVRLHHHGKHVARGTAITENPEAFENETKF
jgi:hypothetical protein